MKCKVENMMKNLVRRRNEREVKILCGGSNDFKKKKGIVLR